MEGTNLHIQTGFLQGTTNLNKNLITKFSAFWKDRIQRLSSISERFKLWVHSDAKSANKILTIQAYHFQKKLKLSQPIVIFMDFLYITRGELEGVVNQQIWDNKFREQNLTGLEELRSSLDTKSIRVRW